jgi:hypothetical protein
MALEANSEQRDFLGRDCERRFGAFDCGYPQKPERI